MFNVNDFITCDVLSAFCLRFTDCEFTYIVFVVLVSCVFVVSVDVCVSFVVFFVVSSVFVVLFSVLVVSSLIVVNFSFLTHPSFSFDVLTFTQSFKISTTSTSESFFTSSSSIELINGITLILTSSVILYF